MTRKTLAVTAILGLSLAAPRPLSGIGPGQVPVVLEWRFDTASNPAPPEFTDPPAYGALATMAPGPFSVGWLDQLPALGDKTGCWDLGQTGQITLTLTGFITTNTQIALEVCQYMDGTIYHDYATIAIPGGRRVGSSLGDVTLGPVGGWFVEKSAWQMDAGMNPEKIVLTAAPSGAVVDRIRVSALEGGSASLVRSAPLVLSIRPLPGSDRLWEISWPASLGAAVLESSPGLGQDAAWTVVEKEPQLTGDRHTLTVEVSGAARFFRLKK